MKNQVNSFSIDKITEMANIDFSVRENKIIFLTNILRMAASDDDIKQTTFVEPFGADIDFMFRKGDYPLDAVLQYIGDMIEE